MHIHLQKSKIESWSYTICKNQLKLIDDLNVRCDTTDFLEESTEKKSVVVGLGNNFFFDMTQMHTQRKQKNGKE